jgi:uncharacterized flavoprotein (TIGR03862 family)
LGKHAQFRVVVIRPEPNRQSVAIIGAGPAGLMAAETIASAGHAVTVYERMASPARKFLMAGRGGLNLTHSEPLAALLARYGGDTAAIQTAVAAFPPERLIAWAEGLGQPTFKGSSGRIFPKAMKASPLLRAWLKRLESLGVVLKLQHTWTGFADEGAYTLCDANACLLTIRPDAVVFAMGGASWPRLGSDGSWISVLERAGIEVAPLRAANCGVLIRWSDIFSSRFAGAPLKRIAVTVGNTMRRGEAVVTRTGLEGGVIYGLGPQIRAALDRQGAAELVIDLKPDMTTAALTKRLSLPRGSQSESNFLRKALSLDAPAIGLMREAGPLPATPDAIAGRIKSLSLRVHGTAGLERAISTAGGVRLSGLTDDLMVPGRPGLFVAGEMLNWDAPTGGYLLQAAFATGQRAAYGALQWLGTLPASANPGAVY